MRYLDRPGRENLRRYGIEVTEEEQREQARKGGIASGQSRKRKKTMLELVNMFGNIKVPDDKIEDLKGIIGDVATDEDYTYNMMVVMALYQKAIQEKDVRAIENVFDLSERTKPTDEQYDDLSVEELRGLLGNGKKKTPKSKNDTKT